VNSDSDRLIRSSPAKMLLYFLLQFGQLLLFTHLMSILFAICYDNVLMINRSDNFKISFRF